jgi:ferredoxin
VNRVALTIEINREVCMGSGNCSFWAPATFDLDEDGIAIVVDPAGDDEEKVILAGQGCPTQAISISRDGEKIV